jgi:hypothetical protein
MRCASFFLSLVFLVFLVSSLGARTIHIPSDSTATTIQGGIDLAVDGDTVMVWPGTYHEYEVDFQGKSIVVMGTDPLDPSVVASTVVDADGQGSVFYFHSGEDTTSVLAGFTITDGYSDDGGGIRCLYSSSPTITWNVIKGNSAWDSGGGIACSTGACPIITHNIITNNTVWDSYGGGGGITVNSVGTMLIADDVISGNSVGSEGTGGGIVVVQGSALLITGCTITDNRARLGGGVYIDTWQTVVVANTIFWRDGAVEIWLDPWYYPTLEISYSDIEGNRVYVNDGSTLIWGDGMVDLDPVFARDGFHLDVDSPLRNAGDPGYLGEGETDIDGELRVLEGRVDIGADEIREIRVKDKVPPVVNEGKESRE